MTETFELRTTQESSGNYRVYATATVGGDQPLKGLAIHTDILAELDSQDYITVTLSGDGVVALAPDKATSRTIRYASAEGPSVRHVYVDPDTLAEFGEVSFDGESTDLDTLPSLAIDSIEQSTEDAYESDKDERQSVDDDVEALFGDDSDESEADDSDESEADDSDESETDDSDESEADDSDESEADDSDESVGNLVSDEELGLTDTA